MTRAASRATETGGRQATTRSIPPKLALAVGRPSIAAPAGWHWAALTDLARLESGHTPSRRFPEYWGGSIPWISIKDAKANHGRRIDDTEEKTNELGIENSSARVLPKDTVCLSRTASVGYVVVMGRPMATSQDFVNWICSKELDPRFLQYLLIAEGDGLLRFASGAVHQTIYFPEAKAFHICYPPLPEQQRIVGILDEAMEGIATAQANTEKNLQNARAIFDSHLQARFAGRARTWKEVRLGDIVTRLTNGYVGPTRDIYVPSGVPYLLARHVKNNRLTFDGKTFVSDAFNWKNKKSILRAGDVLLVQSGHIGHSAVVPKEHEGDNCHAMIVITPVQEIISGAFLSMYFNSPEMRSRFSAIRSGSTVPHLTCAAVKELLIGFPERSEQQSLVSELHMFELETQRLASIYDRKLAALDELKKSLLHQAFTGKL